LYIVSKIYRLMRVSFHQNTPQISGKENANLMCHEEGGLSKRHNRVHNIQQDAWVQLLAVL